MQGAAAAPGQLYTGTHGHEAFEFRRTASRLAEMQSRDWLDEWKARHRPRQLPAGEEPAGMPLDPAAR